MPRRRTTRLLLAASLAAGVAASGVYLVSADAAETVVPGRVQAESYAAQSGARTENTGDTGGGQDVGWLADGDWLRYDNVTPGATVTVRVASNTSAGGTVELHTGTPTGPLLASFGITKTGGWQSWVTVSAVAATRPAGAQTVFAVMTSASRDDFVNLNWFTFGPSVPSPTPTVSPAAPTPAAGWVAVDEAEWQKELAAYNAVTPAPVAPGTTRVPEFHTNCTVANSAEDDAIVLPNLPGASHMHTFFGPRNDASMTTDKLLAATSTTCDAPGDNSAYWVPELQKNGAPVPIRSMRIYYGSRVADPSEVRPFPPGLVMVEGDAKKQAATPKGAGYDSLGGDGLALSSGMASSMHGDFMNGWDHEKLADLVKTCLDQKAKCGTTPTFAGG
jgi:hypothetical protein